MWRGAILLYMGKSYVNWGCHLQRAYGGISVQCALLGKFAFSGHKFDSTPIEFCSLIVVFLVSRTLHLHIDMHQSVGGGRQVTGKDRTQDETGTLVG